MLALTAVSCGHHPSVSQEEIACVRDFIRTSWDASVQYNPTDSQTLIGLPRPYTVPSVSQTFQELYYWDTYFTNEGLVRDGRLDLAKKTTLRTCSIWSTDTAICPMAAGRGISTAHSPLSSA